MKVRLKLKPGQRGTKRLLEQYGDQLHCVRYRYDEKTQKRYTTVELIVAEAPWNPLSAKQDRIAHVKIMFTEVDLRQKIKDAGGTWSNSLKVWKLPLKKVIALGLKERIVDEEEGKKG